VGEKGATEPAGNRGGAEDARAVDPTRRREPYQPAYRDA
jgi:hypothetical protein